ncbi:MAG: hypothetical protein JWO10_459 [Microbacteriaceae bacterium]|nr:hypothetical protein [Microbacteriaceae bacterium]
MERVDAALEVWTDAAGVPQRLVWDGRRYRVTDRPTYLEIPFDFALMTHPPQSPPGWRFQATDDDGRSRMFDIRWAPAFGRWAFERSGD